MILRKAEIQILLIARAIQLSPDSLQFFSVATSKILWLQTSPVATMLEKAATNCHIPTGQINT